MERVVVIITLLFALVASRGIPTKICDITSLSELVDLQTKADFARIACEGGLFNGYECSRYWMLNNDLIRKKLSFAWCKADKRETFRNWAGTSTVNGEFQNDFFATLQKELEAHNQLHSLLIAEHNVTLTLELKEAAETLQLLVDTVNTEAERIRVNTHSEAVALRFFDSQQENETRTLVAASANEERVLDNEEETANRKLVREDANNTRTTTSILANELRILDQTQEENTRQYQQARQDETRTLISTKHDIIRQEITNENTATRATFLQHTENARAQATAEKSFDRQTTEAKDTEEEVVTRGLVRSTDASNVEFDAQQESQTTIEIAAAHEADAYATMVTVTSKEEATVSNFSASTTTLGNQFAEEATSTQTAWASAASSFFALLSVLEGGLGVPFKTISIHLDLIQSNSKGYPVVNAYTDDLNNFMALRAVVNETLNYNLLKYGTSANMRTAQSKFTSAENELKKPKPDYRYAVEYYSNAYVYATTPNNNSD